MPNPYSRGRRLPSNWRGLRSAVMRRDGGQCQIAGPQCTGVATEVDHRKPYAEGGTDEIANLWAVCAGCHRVKSLEEIARGQARRPKARREPERHPGLIG